MGFKYLLKDGIVVVAAVGLFGCGGDPVGPQWSGEIQALITDIPAPGSAFTGTMSANASVSVSTDSTTWVELGSASAVSVVLQSATDTTNVYGAKIITGDEYSYVRLSLSNAVVLVNSGSTFGNVTLVGDRNIILGGADSALVVDLMVAPFVVNDSTPAVLEFDLNSQAYINRAALLAGVVDDATGVGAVVVVVN
ncbi:MAG: hypothetical protein OEZ54_01435 [Gemmatimonadota bacterium]|nr:hypothetical protein [Gemmatimonadota bacterium]